MTAKCTLTAQRQAMHFHFGASISDIQFVYGVSRSAIRNSVHCVDDCYKSIKWENRSDDERENAKVMAWFHLMGTGDPVLRRRAFDFTKEIRARFQTKELFDWLSENGWSAHEIVERLNVKKEDFGAPQLELFEVPS